MRTWQQRVRRTGAATWVLVASAAIVLTLYPGCGASSSSDKGPRFVSAIEAFLQADKQNPPPQHSILFIGSSIFRQWKNLVPQMSPLPVFNRAFGGSRTSDILDHMDAIVLPYQPKLIVYYCGSNDVNASQPAEAIAGRFVEFCERVHANVPGTRILYVSINRVPQKQNKWHIVDSANAMIQQYCDSSPLLDFIDVNRVLFDESGNPRLEFYQPDRLHLTDAAYEEFARVIKPVVEENWNALQK